MKLMWLNSLVGSCLFKSTRSFPLWTAEDSVYKKRFQTFQLRQMITCCLVGVSLFASGHLPLSPLKHRGAQVTAVDCSGDYLMKLGGLPRKFPGVFYPNWPS